MATFAYNRKRKPPIKYDYAYFSIEYTKKPWNEPRLKNLLNRPCNYAGSEI